MGGVPVFCVLRYLIMGVFLLKAGLAWTQTRELLDLDAPGEVAVSAFDASNSVRANGPDTLSFSAANPFFDDFSANSSIPDSNLWYLGSGTARYPNRSLHGSINPPSLGTMVFDGASPSGEAYIQDILASGNADELVSHFLDLSVLGTADQVKLSFFLQPQGRGNAPESADVFRVLFRTNRVGGDPFDEVLRVEGSSLTPFRQYTLNVDRPEYFHPEFQIVFQRTGSMNGYLDQWHLDYVSLAPNRTNTSPVFNDRSVTAITQPPISPYTAVPYPYFLSNFSLLEPLGVSLSNLDNAGVTATTFANIGDPIGLNPIQVPSQLKQSLALPPVSTTDLVFAAAFADQSYLSPGVLELDVRVETADDVPGNDRMLVQYPIDSVFAYDDGEADASYGLNQSRGYGMRYDLPGQQADTLEAIWISFVPRLNPTLSGNVYMKDRAFRIAVWKDAHPDSILIRQVGNIKLKYGEQRDHFQRYKLNKPVEVPATFWVGVEQLDELPLGVGFDLTYNNQSRVYWDSSGVWSTSGLAGTLMIRPEMKTDFITTEVADKLEDSGVVVFPNPVASSAIEVEMKEHMASSSVSFQLLDGLGRQVWNHTSFTPSHMYRLSLPPHIPNGYYHLTIRPGGHKRSIWRTVKLFLNR